MSTYSSSPISILKVTCATCGHHREFDGADLTAGQLDRLGSLVCDNCGHHGAVLMLAHMSETGSALEPPPPSALLQ